MAVHDLSVRVGRRIRALRRAQGLSQAELAAMAGCHTAYVGQLERGEKNATLDSLDRIARALRTDLADLIGSDSTGPIPALADLVREMAALPESEQIELAGIVAQILHFRHS